MYNCTYNITYNELQMFIILVVTYIRILFYYHYCNLLFLVYAMKPYIHISKS